MYVACTDDQQIFRIDFVGRRVVPAPSQHCPATGVHWQRDSSGSESSSKELGAGHLILDVSGLEPGVVLVYASVRSRPSEDQHLPCA